MKKLNDEVTLIKTTGWVYYNKWISTILVVIAVACRSVEEIPRIYDIVFSWLGTVGWLYVSLAWKDRALIILNSVVGFMLFTGLMRNIL